MRGECELGTVPGTQETQLAAAATTAPFTVTMAAVSPALDELWPRRGAAAPVDPCPTSLSPRPHLQGSRIFRPK